MRSPDKIWIEPAWAETFARPDGDPAKVAYIPEAISQAAVAAALEAAAVIAETHQVYQAHVCAARIRAMITQPQHDALAAHVAAEVAKARAEDAAKIEVLVDTVKRMNAACDAMWNDHERLEKNAGYFAGQQPWQLKDAHMRAISEAQQDSCIILAQIGAKP